MFRVGRKRGPRSSGPLSAPCHASSPHPTLSLADHWYLQDRALWYKPVRRILHSHPRNIVRRSAVVAGLVAVALAGCGTGRTITRTVTQTTTVVRAASANQRAATLILDAIPHEFDPAGHPSAIGAVCSGHAFALHCDFAYHFTSPAPGPRRVMAGNVTAECTPKCRVNWVALTVTSPGRGR
jgi:hypothetical protein